MPNDAGRFIRLGSLLAQKLIIDADPGIGDALAIAMALFDPDVDLLGITPTPGCTTGEHASRNIQAIVALLDPPKWPRTGWTSGAACTSTLLGGPNPAVLNGPNGLGNLSNFVPEPHQPYEPAKLLVDLVRTYPHEITLLTLGPLTNVELAQERFPEFLAQLKGLAILGGTVAAGGNVTAAAEFNLYAAPESARAVINSPATKTLIPLDVSSQVVLSYDQYSRFDPDTRTRFGQFLEQTLPFAFRAHHEHLGMEGVPLDELVALAAVTAPQSFSRQSFYVDVETQGELTRGATIVDRRRCSRTQPNIEVLTEVDPQGVMDYLTGIVRRATQIER